MSVQTDYYIPQMKKLDDQISLQATEITRLRASLEDAQIEVRNLQNARGAEINKLRAKVERLLRCWERTQINHQPMIECLVDLREAIASHPRS